jgi:hypothetical protein
VDAQLGERLARFEMKIVNHVVGFVSCGHVCGLRVRRRDRERQESSNQEYQLESAAIQLETSLGRSPPGSFLEK